MLQIPITHASLFFAPRFQATMEDIKTKYGEKYADLEPMFSKRPPKPAPAPAEPEKKPEEEAKPAAAAEAPKEGEAAPAPPAEPAPAAAPEAPAVEASA